MNEEEVNKYRLTSMEEPTDEMLAYIMREAAKEARESNTAAMRKFWNEIAEMRKKISDNNGR
jgi:hypothetical protein